MSKNPNQVIRTLQAHQSVLQAELQEINTDIQLMGQLNNRYHANGVPFDTNLYHLDALRQEKEVILHELSHQISGLYASLQQSMQLTDAVAHTSSAHHHNGAPHHQSFINHINLSGHHHPHGSVMMRNSGIQYHHSSVGGVNHHHINTSAMNHSHSVAHGHNHSYCPYGSGAHNSVINANRSAHLMQAPAPGGVTQLNGPGGMAVTTNSSILVHSPRRVFN
jgi:hypothetical protein